MRLLGDSEFGDSKFDESKLFKSVLSSTSALFWSEFIGKCSSGTSPLETKDSSFLFSLVSLISLSLSFSISFTFSLSLSFEIWAFLIFSDGISSLVTCSLFGAWIKFSFLVLLFSLSSILKVKDFFGSAPDDCEFEISSLLSKIILWEETGLLLLLLLGEPGLVKLTCLLFDVLSPVLDFISNEDFRGNLDLSDLFESRDDGEPGDSDENNESGMVISVFSRVMSFAVSKLRAWFNFCWSGLGFSSVL